MRGAKGVVENGAVGSGSSALSAQGLAGIGIDVKAREVGAGQVQAKAMAGSEEVAGGLEGDGDLDHLAGV